MDWYLIEYLYPAAFNKFKEIMFPNAGILSLSTLDLYDNKKLFYFFDKQGIYLGVEVLQPNQWIYSVSLKNGIVYGPKQESKNSRDEIEIEGFTECFRILDNILRNK